MAEVIDNGMMCTDKKYASRMTGNAGLTLGIIGTALSGLTMLGGLGTVMCGGSGKSSSGCANPNCSTNANITTEELHLERLAAANELENTKNRFNAYLDVTEKYYQGKIDGNEKMANLFFDAYKRDVDNSFLLYKQNRDSKDELAAKIAEVDKKVDIMAACRPFQDALIAEKIHYNALQSDFNLFRRTCKMVEGNVVLPTGVVGDTCPPYVPWSGKFPTT